MVDVRDTSGRSHQVRALIDLGAEVNLVAAQWCRA